MISVSHVLRTWNKPIGRSFSTPIASTLSPHHSIYVSKSTDPYFNLSLEDWLFRHKRSDEPLLLIYRDTPCVVIGRNQNPWTEANMPALRRARIPLIRRRSGGGTVYHDLGNTNFSIHVPRSTFDRHVTTQMVVRAVRAFGVDAYANERNDMCVDGKKVSGSAYKLVNQRAYHHGTMLISTCLDNLGDLLRSEKANMVTRGVASVRSPVCNLQQYDSRISHETFTEAVIREFRKEHHIDEMTQLVEPDDGMSFSEHIRHGMAELKSWEWAYGQTPEFTYTIDGTFSWGRVIAEIRSKRGVILSCSFTHDTNDPYLDDGLTSLAAGLEGKMYGFIDESTCNELEGTGRRADVWLYLKQAMDS